MDIELTPIMIKGLMTALIIIVGYSAMGIAVKLINRNVSDLKKRHTARKSVFYIGTILCVAIVSAFWLKNLRMLTVVISVIGAGLMVAMADVILSIAGWFLILVRRPFDAGDRIQIGDVKGDVIDIRLFQTSLLEIGGWVKEDQSTGRVVHVPNSLLFKTPVFNYTRGFEFLWDEIKLIVTFESNWKKAEEIILRHAQKESEAVGKAVDKRIKKMAEQYLIFYDKLTPIVYTKVVDNGVELSLRYLTEVKRRRSQEDALARRILDDFGKESDINFAYPTYRIVK